VAKTKVSPDATGPKELGKIESRTAGSTREPKPAESDLTRLPHKTAAKKTKAQKKKTKGWGAPPPPPEKALRASKSVVVYSHLPERPLLPNQDALWWHHRNLRSPFAPDVQTTTRPNLWSCRVTADARTPVAGTRLSPSKPPLILGWYHELDKLSRKGEVAILCPVEGAGTSKELKRTIGSMMIGRFRFQRSKDLSNPPKQTVCQDNRMVGFRRNLLTLKAAGATERTRFARFFPEWHGN